jgi:fumarate reductase subunit D
MNVLEKATLSSKGGTRSAVLGALSYFGVLCFIPLMVSDKDEFITFHARQGLVLWGLSVATGFALLLPGIGKLFFMVGSLSIVVLSVAGIISVILNRAWRLPLVHRLATSI